MDLAEARELAKEMCKDVCGGWVGCKWDNNFTKCDRYNEEVKEIREQEAKVENSLKGGENNGKNRFDKKGYGGK